MDERKYIFLQNEDQGKNNRKVAVGLQSYYDFYYDRYYFGINISDLWVF